MYDTQLPFRSDAGQVLRIDAIQRVETEFNWRYLMIRWKVRIVGHWEKWH